MLARNQASDSLQNLEQLLPVQPGEQISLPTMQGSHNQAISLRLACATVSAAVSEQQSAGQRLTSTAAAPIPDSLQTATSPARSVAYIMSLGKGASIQWSH